jgi:hypothetical protein
LVEEIWFSTGTFQGFGSTYARRGEVDVHGWQTKMDALVVQALALRFEDGSLAGVEDRMNGRSLQVLALYYTDDLLEFEGLAAGEARVSRRRSIVTVEVARDPDPIRMQNFSDDAIALEVREIVPAVLDALRAWK